MDNEVEGRISVMERQEKMRRQSSEGNRSIIESTCYESERCPEMVKR